VILQARSGLFLGTNCAIHDQGTKYILLGLKCGVVGLGCAIQGNECAI
jgi:hypothetical protein